MKTLKKQSLLILTLSLPIYVWAGGVAENPAAGRGDSAAFKAVIAGFKQPAWTDNGDRLAQSLRILGQTPESLSNLAGQDMAKVAELMATAPTKAAQSVSQRAKDLLQRLDAEHYSDQALEKNAGEIAKLLKDGADLPVDLATMERLAEAQAKADAATERWRADVNAWAKDLLNELKTEDYGDFALQRNAPTISRLLNTEEDFARHLHPQNTEDLKQAQAKVDERRWSVETESQDAETVRMFHWQMYENPDEVLRKVEKAPKTVQERFLEGVLERFSSHLERRGTIDQDALDVIGKMGEDGFGKSIRFASLRGLGEAAKGLKRMHRDVLFRIELIGNGNFAPLELMGEAHNILLDNADRDLPGRIQLLAERIRVFTKLDAARKRFEATGSYGPRFTRNELIVAFVFLIATLILAAYTYFEFLR